MKINPKDSEDKEDYECYTLTSFTIYSDENNDKFPGEMITLDEVSSNVRCATAWYRCGGVVEYGGQQRYIEGALITDVSIEGFELDEHDAKAIHSVRNGIYVQTEEVGKGWYRLGRPAKEYRQFFHDFLWVANLAKHVVDYTALKMRPDLYAPDHKPDVALQDYCSDFIRVVKGWHGEHQAFRRWHSAFRSRNDFRQAITRHVLFLYNQIGAVGHGLDQCSVWREAITRSDDRMAIKEQPKKWYQVETVVTPYVKACFHTMPWRHYLSYTSISPEIQELRLNRIKALRFNCNTPEMKSLEEHREEDPAKKLLRKAAMKDPEVEQISVEEAHRLIGTVQIVRRFKVQSDKPMVTYHFVYVSRIVHDKKEPYLRVVLLRRSYSNR